MGPVYKFSDKEVQQYNNHGLVKMCIEGINSIMGCEIDVSCLNKVEPPRYIWVKRRPLDGPAILIANKGIFPSPKAIELDPEKTLESITVSLWQGNPNGSYDVELKPNYRSLTSNS